MGLLEGAGNLLDLPGSMVRDVIGGENPFDQFLDPFGQEDRLNITEATGAEGIPGFMLEMLLDPLNLVAGAGLIKSLPKLLKARRAAKAAQAIKRTRAMRQARGRAGGIKSGLTRRKKRVAKRVWGTTDKDQVALVTEDIANMYGDTLRGPPGPGLLSRMKGGIAARGRGLKGRARHGWRQFRRLPRYSQAIYGGKGITGLLGGGGEEEIDIERILNDPEIMEIIMRQALMGGDSEINEPLNVSSPLDILEFNLPDEEYFGPGPMTVPRQRTSMDMFPRASFESLGY